MIKDDLTVLRCWRCSGTGDRGGNTGCWQCLGAGQVFWVNGYSYPYSPDGEKRAREAQKRLGVRA